MNWQKIKVSADGTHFVLDGTPVFGKRFTEVLKFHAPGLAPVLDATGAYHINTTGNPFYNERYLRTFGYYCNRAAVVSTKGWLHLTETGAPAYSHRYAWVGNFQENLCPVRNHQNQYFHIDLTGQPLSSDTYIYCGDFKDGIACVKTANGMYRHITAMGTLLNGLEFADLGIFHKKFATARDAEGWFHINRLGIELYSQRYQAIEPFYNGFALVTKFDDQKIVIDECGCKILELQ
jgi:hypothetical protein